MLKQTCCLSIFREINNSLMIKDACANISLTIAPLLEI